MVAAFTEELWGCVKERRRWPRQITICLKHFGPIKQPQSKHQHLAPSNAKTLPVFKLERLGISVYSCGCSISSPTMDSSLAQRSFLSRSTKRIDAGSPSGLSASALQLEENFVGIDPMVGRHPVPPLLFSGPSLRCEWQLVVHTWSSLQLSHFTDTDSVWITLESTLIKHFKGFKIRYHQSHREMWRWGCQNPIGIWQIPRWKGILFQLSFFFPFPPSLFPSFITLF